MKRAYRCDGCGKHSGLTRSTRLSRIGFNGRLCAVCELNKVPDFFYKFARVLVRI